MSEIQLPSLDGDEKSNRAPGYTVVVVDRNVYAQQDEGSIYREGDEERTVVNGFYDRETGRHALVLRNN